MLNLITPKIFASLDKRKGILVWFYGQVLRLINDFLISHFLQLKTYYLPQVLFTTNIQSDYSEYAKHVNTS